MGRDLKEILGLKRILKRFGPLKMEIMGPL